MLIKIKCLDTQLTGSEAVKEIATSMNQNSFQ